MTGHRSSRLVIGLGSPNGDDQAGWHVIDRLKTQVPQSCQLRRAKVPHELLDWIDDVDEVIIVDACQADSQIEGGNAALQYHLQVENGSIELHSDSVDDAVALPSIRSSNTHQMDLGSVLRLACRLKQQPPQFTLWTIPGQAFGPADSISPQCSAEVGRCADQIVIAIRKASTAR